MKTATRSNRLVVVESPYAGDVEANVAYAKRCVLDCLHRGESPYASHLFFTQPDLLDDLDPEQRRIGIEAGLAWGAAASLVCFYVDRGWSSGMRQGYLAAITRGTPVEIRSLVRVVSMYEYADAHEEAVRLYELVVRSG